MLDHTSFPLIWYATWPHSDFFYLFIQPTGWRVCKDRIQVCACMVLYVHSLYLICNMITFRKKKVLLLTFCFLLLPLWESVIVLCFVVRYFMSILVLQSSWWGSESWLLCLICLPGVLWWLSGSSSRCHGVVCSLWLWYFLIILTYYFWSLTPSKGLRVCVRTGSVGHLAAFTIQFLLDMIHDPVLKKDQVWPGKGGLWVNYLLTMLLYAPFLLIPYATWPCSENFKKLNNFWPHPQGRGGGGGGGRSTGKIFINLSIFLYWPRSYLSITPGSANFEILIKNSKNNNFWLNFC